MTYSAEGNPQTARLVFVGEAPARQEMREGRPFAGTAGRIHDECLEHSGILRSECYTSNVFDYPLYKPKGDKANFFTTNDHLRPNELVFAVRKGYTELGLQSVDRLADELAETEANVIVPLGNPALLAICGKMGIVKWRGSILPATLSTIKGRKCVPSIHPINASYGEYINRYIIKRDYERALKESAFPEIRRPEYDFILYPTFSQCMDMLEWMNSEKKSPLSVDIEVMYGQVERIAFCWSELQGISIPYLGWSEKQEAQLWQATAVLLENPEIAKIFQNGTFDCQILAMVHGVLVKGRIDDTMIAHHIMYPDFKKNLAFLGSLYTDQPYWKDMVTHGDIENVEG